MDFDVIPELPKVEPHRLNSYTEPEVIEKLKAATCQLVLCDSACYFSALDAPLFATMVTLLSSPDQEELCNFLVLVLHRVIGIKNDAVKGHQAAQRTEAYIKTKNKKKGPL
jgi:hypothetical protein